MTTFIKADLAVIYIYIYIYERFFFSKFFNCPNLIFFFFFCKLKKLQKQEAKVSLFIERVWQR
jgi:hypothetical protein